MKVIRLFAFGLFAGLALMACQSNTGKQEKMTRSVEMDTLTYIYENNIKYSENLIKTTETTDTAFFAASYPVFDDTVVNRFVRTALLGNDTVTIQEAADVFIDEFDDFYASDPFPRVWTSESHAYVHSNTATYLALSIHASSYTGGAHGNYATIFKHYDLQTNEPLELDDIVPPPYQNELTAVAERYFRKQESLGVDQPLDNGYFFDQGRFSLPDNFALEPDSMLFLYNIYEIKPYVNGQTELRVPYSDIKRLLTERAERIISELNIQVKP